MNNFEIYGTLGPSCCNQETIEQMFRVGMTGMRLNLSHCNLNERKDWIAAFHHAKKNCGIDAQLLIDMKGPELRLGKVSEQTIAKDTIFSLNQEFLPKPIIENIEINDILKIDDGKIECIVIENKNEIVCKVVRGGTLKPNKSIAIKDKTITGDVLTFSDIENLKQAKEYGVTGIMQPFVRNKEDLFQVKEILKQNNMTDIKIYAKIENMDGVHHLESIIPYCDHIVIARGDLGNATGITYLPVVQKRIEEVCKEKNCPYMVVTEMLSSMIENEIPTRAEVSDIFHAVYHGASSVMLTNETAIGKYPIAAMNVLSEVVKEAKKIK